MASNTATWTVPVSGDTDVALRQHLAIHGLTDRDLPQYVEEAVRWRLFDQEKAASYAFSSEFSSGPPPEYWEQSQQQLLTGAVSRLLGVLRPTAGPVECPSDQQLALVETEISTRLPTDYKHFIKHYGNGSVANYLGVFNPIAIQPWNNLVAQAKGSDQDAYSIMHKSFPNDHPYPRYPQPGGLLPWGTNIDGDTLYWWTITEPDLWPIVLHPRHAEGFRTFGPNMARFIYDIVVTGLGKKLFPGGDLHKSQWIVLKR